MDSDDGLMLNIFQSSNDDSVPSVSGGRRKNKWEERKQRRQNKRFSDRTDISDSRNDEVKNEKLKSNQTASFAYKEKSHKKYDKKEDNDLDVDFVKVKVNKRNESNTAQKTQVISSLFRHNPEIPKLSAQPISKDIPKDEPLFSVQKFSDLPLSEHMISNLEKNLKMKTMTSVQKFAIPALLNGKDVFVKSKTGSGKTLCYALPIVHSLQKIQPKIERCDGPNALVLVPTRELALQSLNLLQKLVKPCQWVVPGYVVGGEKRKSEKARLRKGINILVATPGRLLDHIETTQCLELSKIRWIVLDEADRLLDMGFEKDVSSILQAIKDNVSSNTDFQTVLMSATLNKGIERLVEMFLNDPKFVNETEIQDVDFSFEDKLQNDISKDSALIATMPTQLQQFFIIVPVKMRLVTLAAFLQSKYQETRTLCKVIVFLSSRDSVDFHHSLFQAVLSKDDCKLFKLHGNMTQTERNDVFKEYSTAPAGILLCTDVAARGLDLPNVNWIVQYNTPGSAVDYIHRVGRTARIGTKGQALLFLTPSETGYLETLAEHNLRPKEILVGNVLSSLNANSEKKKDKNKAHGTIDRLSQDAATDLQLKFEEYVLSCPDNMKAAKKAYQSFIRSYATFPVNLKHIFHIKNLHLGHVAKAFALRDAPGGMFDQPKPSKKQKRKQTPITKQKRHKPVGEHGGNDRTCGPRPKKRKKH